MVTQAPPTAPPINWARPFQTLPDHIEEREPTAALGHLLSEIDVDALRFEDRVRMLQARQRLASHFMAEVMGDMASIVDAYAEELSVDRDDSAAAEYAAQEVRAALHLTRRAADNHVILALRLRDELPDLFALFQRGQIDLPRVRAIDDATFSLSPEMARFVVAAILDDAPHLTTGQLRARIRKLILELDPEGAQAEYEAAVERRHLVVVPRADGTADLNASHLPPDRVGEISNRIDHIAQSLRGEGEERTMDQLRADVFMDLLTGASHEKVGRGVVDIRVDLETLSGLASRSGDLGGFGPVVADIARQTVEQNPDAEFRFMVTEPGTRKPVSHGITRRRPTAEQRRIVEMFHLRCVFPGCRMPATQCDLDHRIEWSEHGPTAVSNLAPLCKHDHVIRHDAGWKYFIDDEGEYVWASPLGVVYRQPPDDDQSPLAAPGTRAPP